MERAIGIVIFWFFSNKSKYEYDPITDRYIFTQKVGDFNINYPVILTPKEYDALVTKESVKSYYKEKIDAFSKIQIFPNPPASFWHTYE